MRSLNHLLLLMMAAGVVSWLYAHMLLAALTHQLTQILRFF